MRLLEAICNRPWLITPEALRTIVEVATGERRDEELAAAMRAQREQRPAALAMRQAPRLDGTESVTVRDGVAHLPIVGPIVRYADFFTQVSGLTSVESIAGDFAAALAAPQVRAILLELDSPGGEVTGIGALSEAIYAARQQKPVYAYVDGMAASAGYWLASSASRIISDPAGMLGSIGAVLAVRDPSKYEARSIEFVSSQSPHKRPNPTTDDGRAQYQQIVDQTAEAFIVAVARNRGISEAAVLERYGQGSVLVGKYAVAAGLADGLGTFETTLATLARGGELRSGKEFFMASVFTAEFWQNLFAGAAAAEASSAPGPAVAASLMSAQPGAQPAQPAQPSAPVQPAQPSAAATGDPQRDRERQELEQLRQQIAAAEEEKRTASAKAFAERLISGAQALPAQRAAIEELYTKVAAVSGGPEALEAAWKDAPKHKLLGETVPSAEAILLPAARPAAKEGAQQELDQLATETKAWAESQNGNGRANGRGKK